MATEITKADIAKARQAIADLAELEPRIEKAKKCGLDCEEQDLRCKAMKEFLLAFNEQYSMEPFPRQT